MKCNRCTEDFDHHCKFLNNCIGARNYESFLRILLVMILYNLILIAQGIWLFIEASNDPAIDEAAFSRWGVLVVLIISFVILIAVSILLGFHIYINCCVSMTTLEYLYKDGSSDKKSHGGKTNDNLNKKKSYGGSSADPFYNNKSTPKIISSEDLKVGYKNGM